VRCIEGRHESDAHRVAMRGSGSRPELLVLLWAPDKGTPIRLRLVVVGDHLVNAVDLDLDSADLLRAHIGALLDRARPPEHTGPVPSPDDDTPQSGPIGTRHPTNG
jgi:hypothetical protein